MRRWLWALVVLGCVLCPQRSDAVGYIKFVTITVNGSPSRFSSSDINAGGGHLQANNAQCRLETAEIRYTLDGTTVTATTGTLLEVGEVLSLSGSDILNKFQAIITTLTSAQLDCHVSS